MRLPLMVLSAKKDSNPAVFPIAENLFEREAQFLYCLDRQDQIPASMVMSVPVDLRTKET